MDMWIVTFQGILKFSNFDKIEKHAPLLSNSDSLFGVLFGKLVCTTYSTITMDLPEYNFLHYKYFIIFKQLIFFIKCDD